MSILRDWRGHIIYTIHCIYLFTISWDIPFQEMLLFFAFFLFHLHLPGLIKTSTKCKVIHTSNTSPIPQVLQSTSFGSSSDLNIHSVGWTRFLQTQKTEVTVRSFSSSDGSLARGPAQNLPPTTSDFNSKTLQSWLRYWLGCNRKQSLVWMDFISNLFDQTLLE